MSIRQQRPARARHGLSFIAARLAVPCLGVCLSVTSHADPAVVPAADPHLGADAQRRTLAEALFRQGRTAVQRGAYEEACPKFAESARLDPLGGTLVNLALCYEHLGKTASATAAFHQALIRARHDSRPEREEFCRTHLAQLEPNRSWLAMTVTDSTLPGLTIELDHQPLGPVAWAEPIPIDPGTHQLVATAPGRQTWQTVVVIEKGPYRASVVVPPLAATPILSAASTDSSKQRLSEQVHHSSTNGTSKQKVAGFFVAGAGIAAVAVGAAFGVRALTMNQSEDRETSAWIANIGIGLGAISILGGAYLVLSAPTLSSPRPNSAVSWHSLEERPGVGRMPGLTVTGSW